MRFVCGVGGGDHSPDFKQPRSLFNCGSSLVGKTAVPIHLSFTAESLHFTHGVFLLPFLGPLTCRAQHGGPLVK